MIWSIVEKRLVEVVESKRNGDWNRQDSEGEIGT